MRETDSPPEAIQKGPNPTRNPATLGPTTTTKKPLQSPPGAEVNTRNPLDFYRLSGAIVERGLTHGPFSIRRSRRDTTILSGLTVN